MNAGFISPSGQERGIERNVAEQVTMAYPSWSSSKVRYRPTRTESQFFFHCLSPHFPLRDAVCYESSAQTRTGKCIGCCCCWESYAMSIASAIAQFPGDPTQHYTSLRPKPTSPSSPFKDSSPAHADLPCLFFLGTSLIWRSVGV
jgi:hypothetical protein